MDINLDSPTVFRTPLAKFSWNSKAFFPEGTTGSDVQTTHHNGEGRDDCEDDDGRSCSLNILDDGVEVDISEMNNGNDSITDSSANKNATPNETEIEERDGPEASQRPPRPSPEGQRPLKITIPEPPASKEILECNFDATPTALYVNLLRKQWEKVNSQLKEYPVEAKTWVSRFESNGSIRWRLLPIHAAVVFKAPLETLKEVYKGYPDGIKCTDDQGMLPLHLSIRNVASEEVVKYLLKTFPEALEVQDMKGRTPLDLANKASLENREMFLHALDPNCLSRANSAEENSPDSAVDTLQRELEGMQLTLQTERSKWACRERELYNEVKSLQANKNEAGDRDSVFKLVSLQNQVKRLTESETNLRDENHSLREDKVSLKVHLDILDKKYKEIKQYQNENERGNKERTEALQEEKDFLEATLKHVKANYEESERKAAAQESALRSECTSLQEDRINLKQSLDELQESKDVLFHNFIQLKEEYDTLAAEHAKEQEEKETLKMTLEATKASFAETVDKMKQEQSQQNNFEKEKQRADALQSELNVVEKIYMKTKSELEDVRGELDLSKALHSESKNQLKELHTRMTEQVSKLRSDNSSLQVELEIAQAKAADARKEVEEVESLSKTENAKLWEENDSLQHALKAAQEKFDETKVKLDELVAAAKDESDRLSEDVETLTLSLKFEEDKMEGYEAEIKSLKKQVTILIDEKTNGQTKLQLMEKSHEELKDQFFKVSTKKVELESVESRVQSENIKLLKTIASLEQEKTDLINDYDDVENELEEVKRHSEEAQMQCEIEIQHLVEEKAELEEALRASEAKCEEAAHSLNELEHTLKEEYETLWEENQTLQEEKQEFSERAEKQQKETLQQLHEIEVSLVSENGNLTSEKESLRHKLTAVVEQVANKNEAERNLREEIDRLSQVEQKLREELARISQTKQQLEVEKREAAFLHACDLKEFSGTLTHLRSQMSSLAEEKQLLEEKISIMEESNTRLQKENIENHTKVESGKAQISDLIAKKKRLEDQLGIAEDKIRDHHGSMKGIRLNVAMLEMELKSRKESESGLKSQNYILGESLKSLQAELEVAQARHESNANEVQSVQRMCDESLRVIKNRVTEIEKEKQEVHKQYLGLLTEHDRLRGDADTRAVSLAIEQKKFEDTAGRLGKIRDECENRVKIAEAEKNAIEQSMMSLMAEKGKLVVELKASKEELENLTSKYDIVVKEKEAQESQKVAEIQAELGHKMSLIQEELDLAREQFDATTKQLEETKSSYMKLKKWSFSIMKDGNESAVIKAERDEAETRAALAQSRVESLEEKLEELKSNINAEKRELIKKRMMLERTVQGFSEGLLSVSRVVDEMAETQENIVHNAAKHEAHLISSAQRQSELTENVEQREEFFQKATSDCGSLSKELRTQGEQFEEHMEACKNILVRWSNSVGAASSFNSGEQARQVLMAASSALTKVTPAGSVVASPR